MSKLTSRTEQLAVQFETVNAEVIATVTSCTDEQWRQPSTSEGWPVGVVAHHIAVVQQAFAGIIQKLAAGETYTPKSSMDEVHQNNARHARDHADAGKPETLEALHTNGAAMANLLRSLSDEHLNRPAGVFGGHEMSVNQVVEWIVIGHSREHLASIRATIGN